MINFPSHGIPGFSGGFPEERVVAAPFEKSRRKVTKNFLSHQINQTVFYKNGAVSISTETAPLWDATSKDAMKLRKTGFEFPQTFVIRLAGTPGGVRLLSP